MNERIRELAEQAQKVIWAADGNVTELTDLDIEKFAELIVRECAEVAGCNGHISGFELSDLIKQHFGVK